MKGRMVDGGGRTVEDGGKEDEKQNVENGGEDSGGGREGWWRMEWRMKNISCLTCVQALSLPVKCRRTISKTLKFWLQDLVVSSSGCGPSGQPQWVPLRN